MDIAFGLKAHSGWAALVGLAVKEGGLTLVERCRLELADARDGEWARQPYHAAEGLPSADARATVERGIGVARRMASAGIADVVARAATQGHRVVGCGVLVGEPMPDWTVDEILAVHFRMHKAEGVLYRDVLVHGAEQCGLDLVTIPEKQLTEYATRAIPRRASGLVRQIATLGRSAGPPWGKDQKDAALAALLALGPST